MPLIVSVKTTSLADVRRRRSRHVEDVVKTHERVTISRNGEPAAALISAEELEALEETLFWARQEHVDMDGPIVGLDVVTSDVRSRQDRG